MKNIKLTLQYDGARYLGWVRPKKDGFHRTVSHRISEVIKKTTGEECVLFAGAKTEAGVHALSQTAGFQTGSGLSAKSMRSLFNQYLPQDISILSAEEMPERFRADLNARSRTYIYRICTSRVYDIFTADYTVHISPCPDIPAMERAASLLKGRHDFRGFCGGRTKKRTEKEILDLRFEQTEHMLILTVTANDFLYQMPSLLIGTLLEVGTGKRAPESVASILAGKEKADAPCETRGLLLKSISYL